MRKPLWQPARLAQGLAEGKADLIVGVENPAETGRNKYSGRTAQLWWELPPEAATALRENYTAVAKFNGFVLYVNRRVAPWREITN